MVAYRFFWTPIETIPKAWDFWAPFSCRLNSTSWQGHIYLLLPLHAVSFDMEMQCTVGLKNTSYLMNKQIVYTSGRGCWFLVKTTICRIILFRLKNPFAPEIIKLWRQYSCLVACLFQSTYYPNSVNSYKGLNSVYKLLRDLQESLCICIPREFISIFMISNPFM